MRKKATRLVRETQLNDIEEKFRDNFLLDFKIKRPFYLNHNHKDFYNQIRNKETNMVFVDGPAGSAKTYIAIYAALEELNQQLKAWDHYQVKLMINSYPMLCLY